MPYIGNTAANRFVASKAASVFSGDGSTTAFTLDHGVGSDEDILVSVDGVIQEPSVAYSVSGTTLTFTAAPSSNSGNNIFVYYLFRTVGTVSHPSSNALQATTGAFSGDVTIGDASASDKKILFDGNAQDFHIGLDDSSDSLTIGLGSALGTTSHMIFDANGHITKPLQPAFRVSKGGTDQTSIANDGAAVTVTFGTEVFDQNGDFSSNTFTAPVAGKYLLTLGMRVNYVDTVPTFYIASIETTNNNYHNIIDPNFSADPNYFTFKVAAVADMDASDTADVKIRQSGGTVQSNIAGSAAYTYFTGVLLC